MDAVFKALADPTRRSLLDELFKQDGQTLSALEQRLPMTRAHDRWVSKYAEPWAAALTGLKKDIEEDNEWKRSSRSTSRRRPARATR